MIPALIVGWFLARRRVRRLAAQRIGYTGQFPVVAERPLEHRDERPGQTS